MANRDKREALRGEEEETFDLIAQVLTSKQWAELLKAPLERAVAKGNRGLAQKLPGAGAECGDSLHAATRGGHEGIVNDLLENGAPVSAEDVSYYGHTPLHVAAIAGKTEMVQLLLLHGADKDALDNRGWTPLFVVASYGHAAAALTLLAGGADISLRCGQDYKESVMHMAAHEGHVGIMRAAVERGADVNAGDTHQNTPLHFAAPFNIVKVIDVLVEAGANVQARNGEGITPLHQAAGDASLEAVLALLKYGARVNAKSNDQNTPLHRAAGVAGIQGAAETVDSLLRSGADETILNDEGKAAPDVVGLRFEEEEDLLAEDPDREHKLLANAPADRAWRRRGYLVLCRAHPDRVQQIQDISIAHASMARRTRSGAKLGRTEASGSSGAVDASPVDERGGGDWAVVMAMLLRLQEEGIFRAIVGYL